MNFEDFGVVIEDPYAEQDPAGVDLWLKLLCEARDVSLEFYAVLNYLRGTGTLLQKDSKFGYRLVPVINENAWHSVEEYNHEKQYLQKWLPQLVQILRGLGNGYFA
ncbi:MAG: hypothetical protein IKK97_02600 [Phascolarctobacterium sp.]|nr:hypothetical protein [Phascolarctobacterium sp.]